MLQLLGLASTACNFYLQLDDNQLFEQLVLPQISFHQLQRNIVQVLYINVISSFTILEKTGNTKICTKHLKQKVMMLRM